MNENLKAAILSVIKDVSSKKVIAKKEPNFCTYKELLQEVKIILNELHRSGVIEVSDNINDRYFKVL